MELPLVVIFVWLTGFWASDHPMICFSISHTSVGVVGIWEACVRALVWVGGTLLFLNWILSCRVYLWFELAFWNYCLKTLSRNENEGDFVFCFWRAFNFSWWIFCEALDSFWYSSTVSHPASDLSVILINLFLYISLLLMDGEEEWGDSLSLFSTWWIDSWISYKISTCN